MKTSTSLLQLSLAISLCVISLEAQIPANSLCSTGLTPKSPTPGGCTTSVLVNPINPVDGGPITDGNWELATPYPSASIGEEAPNPCTSALTYAPAPVSAPNSGWYNPDDGLSQWISPNGGDLPPGWYVYRTAFTVPPAYETYTNFDLELNGQMMADDRVGAIYIADLAGASTTCHPIGAYVNPDQYEAWKPFSVGASVLPATGGFLYFIIYNAGTTTPNPTGLRVEFTSATYYPYTPDGAN